MNDEPTGWQPPQFKEYRSDTVKLDLRDRSNPEMVKFMERIQTILTRSLSEGATAFELQWQNVLSRDDNPDGTIGTVRITSTR